MLVNNVPEADCTKLIKNAHDEGIYRFAVGGVCRSEDGTYLTLKRAPHEFMADSWEFPGGSVEEGESLISSLAREIREETGLRCTKFDSFIDFIDYSAENSVTTRQFNFLVDTSGTVRLSEEHQSFCWGTEQDLLRSKRVSAVFQPTLRRAARM